MKGRMVRQQYNKMQTKSKGLMCMRAFKQVRVVRGGWEEMKAE